LAASLRLSRKKGSSSYLRFISRAGVSRNSDCHRQMVLEGASNSSRDRSCSGPKAVAALNTQTKMAQKEKANLISQTGLY
jgi:hypothetical protein